MLHSGYGLKSKVLAGIRLPKVIQQVLQSYQSLLLKAHYPLEFMVAVINNFGGFYSHEFYFHELRMCGGKIQAPCINNSEWVTNIKGDIVHIGFDHLKSIEDKAADMILKERNRNGPYMGMINFLKSVNIGLEQLRILIRIGGFRFTGKAKQELMSPSADKPSTSRKDLYTDYFHDGIVLGEFD